MKDWKRHAKNFCDRVCVEAKIKTACREQAARFAVFFIMDEQPSQRAVRQRRYEALDPEFVAEIARKFIAMRTA